MSRRILVTGSRDWTDFGKIEWFFYHHVREGDTIVHGGARGADAMAGRLAELYGCKEEVFPAAWSTHGKRAGFVRNAEMVATKPDLVLAFQKNRSRGTQMTIDLAREAGIPVKGWRVEKIDE